MPDWSLSKKRKGALHQSGQSFPIRDTCVTAPSTRRTYPIHKSRISPIKPRMDSLSLSCRYLPLPRSRWLNVPNKGSQRKKKKKLRGRQQKAPDRRSFVSLNERVSLEVCSPFLQSQLCTSSWPRCPTERRQHCGGWLHSSPGSLSPVEADKDTSNQAS